jgi:hypothetical protein
MSTWPTLKAMAENYGDGPHRWDHLDKEACWRGAEEIRALREALELASNKFAFVGGLSGSNVKMFADGAKQFCEAALKAGSE